MIKLARILIFIATMPLGIAVAERNAPYVFCKTDAIEIAVHSSGSPVEFGRLRFESDEQGSSTMVYVRNSSPHSIRRLILQIEFLRRGNHLLTTAFAAATRGTNLPTVFGLGVRFHEELPDQLLPGQPLILHGSSGSVTTQCPSDARLTYIYAEGQDTAPYTNVSPSARTDPELIEIPRRESAPPIPEEGIVITTRVDDHGGSTLRAVNKPSGELFQRFRDWVSTWKFVPATFDGHPITSDFELVLRVRPDRSFRASGWPPDCDEGECTFAILDLLPASRRSELEFWYGGAPLQ